MRLFDIPEGPQRDKASRATIDLDDLMVSLAQATSEAPPLDKQLDPIGIAIKQAEPAACVIYVTQAGVTWTGSGFLVTNDFIVTADHVLPEPENGSATVTASFSDEVVVPAEVVLGDGDADVGVLRCMASPQVTPVQISQTPTDPGDIIAVIGAPEGWPDVVTVGRVSATDMTPPQPPDTKWTDMTFVDAHILEGSSGSMVIDVTGDVIGMVMGVIGKRAAEVGMGQNAVVPAERISAALDRVRNVA